MKEGCESSTNDWPPQLTYQEIKFCLSCFVQKNRTTHFVNPYYTLQIPIPYYTFSVKTVF